MRTPGRPTRITSTSTDGVVASAGATLHTLVNNKASAGVTATIYNAASEADTTTPFAVLELDTRGAFEYEAYCSKGIVVIVSGACDLTVVTR